MSIFFLEGLPGAGKSYECVIRHLLPALRSGRVVITNVPGLNHDEIKTYLGQLSFNLTYIDIDTPVRAAVDAYIEVCSEQNRPAMQQVMMTIAATEAQKMLESVLVKDALILLDEVQNYFGSSSGALPVATIRFFAEHRHQGLDLVLMGQHVGDVHDLIRHRIEVLTHLQKLVALGVPTRYSWTNYTLSGGKRQKIRNGVEKYEKKIFAIYKSHDDGTGNKELYVDERNNIFNGAQFKIFLPLFTLAALVAAYWLYNFIWGDNRLDKMLIKGSPVAASSVPAVRPASSVLNIGPASSVRPVSAVFPASSVVASGVSAVPSVAPQFQPSTYFTFVASESSVHQAGDFYETFFQKYRARYSAFVQSSDKRIVRGYLDFVKEDLIVERLQFPALMKAGFKFDLQDFGTIKLTSPAGKVFFASAWPVNAKTFGDERSGHAYTELRPVTTGGR